MCVHGKDRLKKIPRAEHALKEPKFPPSHLEPLYIHTHIYIYLNMFKHIYICFLNSIAINSCFEGISAILEPSSPKPNLVSNSLFNFDFLFYFPPDFFF